MRIIQRRGKNSCSRREAHGCGYWAFRQWSGLYLHHPRVSRRSRGEARIAARYCDFACGPDNFGRGHCGLGDGRPSALLKDAVTTPAGCTIDGILELEEGKLRVTLIKAVVKAAQRAKELANG